MLTALAAFALATAVAAALTPVVRHVAHRFDFLDHALSSRKVHGKPIPRLGGVAIVLGFFAPITALLFVNTDVGRHFLEQQNRVIGLFVGGGVIALLGLY